MFRLPGARALMVAALATASLLAVAPARAEQLPASVRGTWRIARILPTSNTGCWTRAQAQSLVGTRLTYTQDWMRWRGGTVPLQDIDTRQVSASEFSQENTGLEQPASFTQIGVRAPSLLEVDMQHPDAAVLPASTEIPGDSVLVVSPSRIVVSACGVYFEATRTDSRGSIQSASATHARTGSERATGR